jgi:hypothetical protein
MSSFLPQLVEKLLWNMKQSLLLESALPALSHLLPR